MYSSNRIIQCCRFFFFVIDSWVVRVTHKANNLNYSTHYFVRNHFIFALQELYTFLQMVNMVRVESLHSQLSLRIFLTCFTQWKRTLIRSKQCCYFSKKSSWLGHWVILVPKVMCPCNFGLAPRYVFQNFVQWKWGGGASNLHLCFFCKMVGSGKMGYLEPKNDILS